ncbi:MAG TPA: protein kinase [Bacteroidota bacterium]|nr:protein kinase [Bacteroidota bacterium]
MIGATIGHYKIIKKLGQGGMGIVYQGQDMKLDRLVALKFLPPHMLEQETERARFMQEAKSASALNHPNVCIIHTIEEAASQQFIVMEYVDGDTLRNKFREAPLKLNDALDYAIQMGEALAEAHAKGIVHRDIKADNIMVNSKGQVKVMDFGLAKLKGSLKLTRSSSTVGTLAYMAPEQIQGGEVDARSDIFSYGIVLYELLTQKTPFRGEHEAAMVYSIVNEDPDPLEKHRPELSPEVSRIVMRSLEKDPEDRYQSIADMVSELKRLRKDSTRVSRPSAKYPAMAAEQKRSREIHIEPADMHSTKASKSKWWIAIAAIVLVAGAGVTYYLKFMPQAPPPRVITLNPAMTFHTVQVPFTDLGYPGISPDGNWAAFPASDINNKWDVYYMNVAGGEPRRITSDSSASVSEVDISPDGGRITYDRWNSATQQYDVCVVSALGGITKRVAEGGYRPRWSPDGSRVGYLVNNLKSSSASGLLEFWTVQADGENKDQEFVENLATPALSSFSWSPDGKTVAYLRSFIEGYQEIFAHELSSSPARQLTTSAKNIGDISWSRQGDILFSSERGGNANVWMMMPTGDGAVQVTKGSGPDVSMKISADGKRVLYLEQLQTGRIWLADSNGLSARQLSLGEHGIRSASLSPDGRQLALEISDIDPLKKSSHIHSVNLDGSGLRQLTSGNEISSNPEWSPDGRWISYFTRLATEPEESSRIYIVDPSTEGKPRLLGNGLSIRWFDATRVLIQERLRTVAAFIDNDQREQFYDDSTLAIPILDRDYVLYRDLHHGREGWWIVGAAQLPGGDTSLAPIESLYGPLISNEDIDSLKIPPSPWGQKPLRVLPAYQEFTLGPEGRYLLYTNDRGEIWKMTLPDRRRDRLTGSVAARNVSLHVTQDGRTMVFVESRSNSKMVMIENLQ